MKVSLVSSTNPALPGLETLADQIAYVARVSNPTNQMNTSTSDRLLKYLRTHKHWSPFEMVHMTVEIQTTRAIARQILRHRSFSFQEFSQRYAEVDQEFVISQLRMQDKTNRQNSIEVDEPELEIEWERRQLEVIEKASLAYQWAIRNGLAKEVARNVLPEGLTKSTMYMSGSVRSWIHYVELRSDNGTQKEHREIAQACGEILRRQGIEN